MSCYAHFIMSGGGKEFDTLKTKRNEFRGNKKAEELE